MPYTLKDLLEDVATVYDEGYHIKVVYAKNGGKKNLDIYFENDLFTLIEDGKTRTTRDEKKVYKKYGDITNVVVNSQDVDPIQENKISVPLKRVLQRFPDESEDIHRYHKALQLYTEFNKKIEYLKSVIQLFRAFACISTPDLDSNHTFDHVRELYNKQVFDVSRARLLKTYMNLFYFYIYLKTKTFDGKGFYPTYGSAFLKEIVFYGAKPDHSENEVKAFFKSQISSNLHHFKAIFSDFPEILSADRLSVNTHVIEGFLKTEWGFIKRSIENIIDRHLGNNNNKKEVLKILYLELDDLKEKELKAFITLTKSELAKKIAELREGVLWIKQ